MADYDSILKEKKKYEEPIKDDKNEIKKFPSFKISILCIMLILIVSYIVYFMTILTPKQIFFNDVMKVYDKYQGILEHLNLNKLNDNSYNINGTINLNDLMYYFSFNKSDETTKLNLSLNNEDLDYYEVSNHRYIKLSNFKEQYYELDDNDYFAIMSSLKNYFTNITEDKFVKKFYLSGSDFIVESNLILNDEDIKEALDFNNLDNSYEVLFTFKNNALSNEIISMKITINNLKNGKREMLLYENDYLTYTTDNQNLKFYLEEKNDDFSLKIYQNDILFSVLTGSTLENSYQYTYQVIDKIYNINLNVSNENDIYSYELVSTIEKDEITTIGNINVTFQYTEDSFDDSIYLDEYLSYDSLNDMEKEEYKGKRDNIIGELRQFVKQYQ